MTVGTEGFGTIFRTGAGGGGGGGGIVWSPAGNGTAKTWAEVRTLIQSTPVPQRITFPELGDYVMGVDGEVTDFHGSVFEGPIGGGVRAIIAPGAQIRNLGLPSTQGDVTIVGQTNLGLNPIGYDPQTNPFMLSARIGGSFSNEGTVPMMAIPNGALIVFVLFEGGKVNGPGTGPIIFLGTGSICILATTESSLGALDPSWIAGDATSLLGIESAGFDFSQIATWAGFSGFVANIPFNVDGGTGPTALRPIPVMGPMSLGTRYFDADLPPTGLPIWWDGTQWINAAGVGPQ